MRVIAFDDAKVVSCDVRGARLASGDPPNVSS